MARTRAASGCPWEAQSSANATGRYNWQMDTLEDREAQLADRIRRLRRAQRAQLLHTAIAVALGIAIGFALAEALIDPVTVITSGCDGIRT
jgi:predicted NBD/HSP70 family sugar kinase